MTHFWTLPFVIYLVTQLVLHVGLLLLLNVRFYRHWYICVYMCVYAIHLRSLIVHLAWTATNGCLSKERIISCNATHMCPWSLLGLLLDLQSFYHSSSFSFRDYQYVFVFVILISFHLVISFLTAGCVTFPSLSKVSCKFRFFLLFLRR